MLGRAQEENLCNETYEITVCAVYSGAVSSNNQEGDRIWTINIDITFVRDAYSGNALYSRDYMEIAGRKIHRNNKVKKKMEKITGGNKNAFIIFLIFFLYILF